MEEDERFTWGGVELRVRVGDMLSYDGSCRVV